ncbi:MAG: hypothetical protein K2W82_06195 [Candidatus Obscuribacterales bacterium]|nr:hypothetical protein [Candidatus Obscuribacterales bacterium]
MNKDLSYFGKHFLVEPKGTRLTKEESDLLKLLQPRAIMFRKRNFLQEAKYDLWHEEYSQLLADCRQALGDKDIIVSVDHEGGRVIRPPLPITPFPYADKWSSSISAVAAAMATELKSIGINVNFAPVADINSNPDNPVIGSRAFAHTPELVSAAALEFAKTLQAHGVIPCAKHFPGHGDTKSDSHYSSPILDLNLAELEKRELVPFQALINAGVPMVMTAHLLFPQIDPDHIATNSKKILTELLRQKMGFKGIIIADALGMKAGNDIIKQEENIAKALNAGLDIFLVAGDNVTMDDALKTAVLMDKAAKEGRIEADALESSQKRIELFLQNLPQYTPYKLDAQTFSDHHELAAKLANTGMPEEFKLSLPGFE